MTWVAPRDLLDNTVITAAYWNQVLGANGSVVYLQRASNRRASCTVFSAPFTQVIPVTTALNTNTTRITSFSIVPTNTSVTNRLYFNRNTGAISLPGNAPVLMLWSIRMTNSSTNITLRSTLELQRRRQERLVVSTAAAEYLFKNDANQNILNASFATFTWWNADRYFITCNHNHSSNITINGTITIIVNPCFV